MAAGAAPVCLATGQALTCGFWKVMGARVVCHLVSYSSTIYCKEVLLGTTRYCSSLAMPACSAHLQAAGRIPGMLGVHHASSWLGGQLTRCATVCWCGAAGVY
jgi:hypothetical protein